MGESVERETTANLIESIKNEKIDSLKFVKNLLNYMTEESVSKFADEYNYFDSDVAHSVSVYENHQCANMFMEMIEDNMVESKILAADLLDYMDESEVKEFAEDMGYISSKTDIMEQKPLMLGESGISFQKIFNSTIKG
jgi:hypothetical protein